MKITFINPAVSQGGGSRVVATYAQKLQALDHDVTVIARTPRKWSKKERISNLLGQQKIYKPDPNRTVYFQPLGDKFIEVDREGPLLPEDIPDGDVIIATWWRTAFEVATMPAEKGKKVYFVQGHEVFPYVPWDISAGSYHLPLRKVTISSYLSRIMAERYGDKDVPIISNSIDTAEFAAIKRKKNQIPTVGLIYSFAQRAVKGTVFALEAIETLRQEFPNLKVVSFGTEAVNPALPLPPGSTFTQLPSQVQIPQLYASCDAWIIPSLNEGFGLPLLEAMATGTPVVATCVGAAEDFIDPGETGFLADPADAEGLVAGLTDILRRTDEAWASMSEAATKKVVGYSWDDATQLFDNFLRDTLARDTV